MKTSYNQLAKIFTNCFGHMTKMADIPIYGKNPFKSLLQNQKAEVCNIWDVVPTNLVQMMIPRLTLTYLTLRSNLLPNAFKFETF